MGWLEIILLALGASVLAANQLLRDAPNISLRFPSLRPRGWWNYLPFAFVVLAGLVYSARLLLPDEPPPPSLLNERQSSPPTAVAALAPEAAPMQSSSVIEGIPLGRLIGSFEGHTELEAERLIAPFDGAPVQVRGTVSTVDGVPGRRTVWLNEHPVRGVQIGLWLTENQDALAERLQVNDRIRAACELGRLTRTAVSLRRCQFSGDGPSPMPPFRPSPYYPPASRPPPVRH